MKNIAIVCGGNSGEYEVSMASGRAVYKHIDTAKYRPFLVVIKGQNWEYLPDEGDPVTIDKSDFSFELNGKHITFDGVFNAIHGTPGEDGKLQGYFDLLKIPTTSCSVDTASLSFNKFLCNRFIQSFGIQVARSFSFVKDEIINKDEVLQTLGLPVFVKPASSGSSVGVSKVSSPDQFQSAVDKAFHAGSRVLFEEFIDGREIACGLLKNKKELLVFPLTEVISHNDFFDFEAKYQGKSKEITPAELDEEAEIEIKTLSSFLYRQMDCKGFVRFDYILTKDGLYFLELNSIPGMTEASLLPQQARAFGLSEKEFFTMVVDNLFT